MAAYIAPESVETVAYSVKRPGRLIKTSEGSYRETNVYWYNKLMSQSAIFAPAEQSPPRQSNSPEQKRTILATWRVAGA